MSKFDPRKVERAEKCGATSKRRFKSRESAIEFADSLRTGNTMRSYECQFCAGWHLTSHARQ